MKIQLFSSQRMVTPQTTILLLIIIVLISSSVYPVESKTTTTSKSGHPRGDKMLRLCLWTHCRRASTATSGKCPSYLEQSAVRKCKLENGDIGYYSKCCLYEDAVPYQMQKTSGATTAWPEARATLNTFTASTSSFSDKAENDKYLFANMTYKLSGHHDNSVAVEKENAPLKKHFLLEWLTISSYLEPRTSDDLSYHSLIFCGVAALATTVFITLFIYIAFLILSFSFPHLLFWLICLIKVTIYCLMLCLYSFIWFLLIRNHHLSLSTQSHERKSFPNKKTKFDQRELKVKLSWNCCWNQILPKYFRFDCQLLRCPFHLLWQGPASKDETALAISKQKSKLLFLIYKISIITFIGW